MFEQGNQDCCSAIRDPWFIECRRCLSCSPSSFVYGCVLPLLSTSGPLLPQMPPKRDETALQEEEELQLAIALSQSEAEEKERMVREIVIFFSLPSCSMTVECFYRANSATKGGYSPVCTQRQKNSFSVYPKTDPTPVTSSAPPVNTLYSSPVVRLCSEM